MSQKIKQHFLSIEIAADAADTDAAFELAAQLETMARFLREKGKVTEGILGIKGDHNKVKLRYVRGVTEPHVETHA